MDYEVSNMIFGDLINFDLERGAFSPAIVKAIDYIKNTNFETLENGRYEIDGENMFALISEPETKAASEALAETHQKYIDVQAPIVGTEIIGFARNSDDNIVSKNLLEDCDAILYSQVKDEIDLILTPGKFAVFFPFDVHRPCCMLDKPEKIRKVVIKIHRDLFNGLL